MSNMVSIAEKEVMRNEILKMCQEAAPQGASVQVIRAGLKKVGISVSDNEVESQLSYLESKALIKVSKVENERLNIRRVIAGITAEGTDLLDGNADAVGIANS